MEKIIIAQAKELAFLRKKRIYVNAPRSGSAFNVVIVIEKPHSTQQISLRSSAKTDIGLDCRPTSNLAEFESNEEAIAAGLKYVEENIHFI